ncbi:hypothetical protein KCP76_21605 [Salmonella enterica subsp. enterica serovar Weltevreden]|nr:hypothetical protein KCP76_21605 [Salmonella enterica subsp. enterica serovar Weltevreden]
MLTILAIFWQSWLLALLPYCGLLPVVGDCVKEASGLQLKTEGVIRQRALSATPPQRAAGRDLAFATVTAVGRR